MSNKTNLDALNMHLFDAIEMLKNNSDKNADDCEKIDIPTARAIAELGKVIVEGYKVKAHVLQTVMRSDDPDAAQGAVGEFGIDAKKLLNGGL